jgi:formylglycine-generating enzyme required for sulfatase activity
LGGARNILNTYLDKVVEEVAQDPERIAVVHSILKTMIDAGTDTRSFVAIEGFKRALPDVNEAEILKLIEKLLERRVVEERKPAYSLSHDHMVGKVKEWFDPRELERKRAEETLARGLMEWKNSGALLDRGQVERIRKWLPDPVPAEVTAFLAASQRAARRNRRRRIAGVAGAVVALPVIAVLGWAGLVGWGVRAVEAEMEFVSIPAGCFQMGSPDTEAERKESEGPVHNVCLEVFELDKFELTQRQWRRVMVHHRDPSQYKGDRRPVESVTWSEAQTFIRLMNVFGRHQYRLPSEAEWEYAARAGTTTARYWGERVEDGCAYENMADLALKKAYPDQTVAANCDDGQALTAPVGSFKPNPWGLYDMLGNVAEWVEDCYVGDYREAPKDGSAVKTQDCAAHVARGGSFGTYAYSARGRPPRPHGGQPRHQYRLPGSQDCWPLNLCRGCAILSNSAILTTPDAIGERREMPTQSLPAVSLRIGNRLPAAQVLLRGVNYLICMALWLIGWVISGLESSFLPALREAPASVDPEELGGGAAEDGDALVVAEAGDRHDVVDRYLVPRERVVGADHHLADAALGDQVAHPFRREHDRVEKELAVLEVLGRLLLRQRADPVREGRDHRIRARGVGRQKAAAMGGTDLQARKAVEGALEDQVRERDRGFERVADRVGQEAAALEPAARLELAGPERMHEDQDAELLGLGPDRVEFRVGQFLPGHTAADREAAQPQCPDPVLELLDREVGMLQGYRRKGDKAVGCRRAELGELLVLDPDQLGRRVALGAIPKGVDAERLDVDPLDVHLRDAVGDVGPQQPRRLQRVVDDGRRLRNDGMGVDVDGLDPLAVDHDLAPPPRHRRGCRIPQAASDKRQTGQGAGDEFP